MISVPLSKSPGKTCPPLLGDKAEVMRFADLLEVSGRMCPKSDRWLRHCRAFLVLPSRVSHREVPKVLPPPVCSEASEEKGAEDEVVEAEVMPRWKPEAPSSKSRRPPGGGGVWGAPAELWKGGREEFPDSRKHPSWWVLRYLQPPWKTGMQVCALYRTLGSASGLWLERLFGMCPMPSRATFGLTCYLPSSSSSSAPPPSLDSLNQCQEIVGQR